MIKPEARRCPHCRSELRRTSAADVPMTAVTRPVRDDVKLALPDDPPGGADEYPSFASRRKRR